MHDIHSELLARGLSKSTIDGAVGSLSAVLGYVLREHRIESSPALRARADPADTRLQPTRKRQERRWEPSEDAGRLVDAVDPRYWSLILTPFLTGVRTEELLALREQYIDTDRELILVHRRATPGDGRPDKPGVLKPGLKERRRLVRAEPDVRGRWALFPRVLHSGCSGQAVQAPGEENVLRLARSEFLYVTSRTRGSRDEQQLTEQQKLQGSIWSQRNLYRDVIEPARREVAGVAFTSTTRATRSSRHSWPPACRSPRSPLTVGTPSASSPPSPPATGDCAHRRRWRSARTRPVRPESGRWKRLTTISSASSPPPRSCKQRSRRSAGFGTCGRLCTRSSGGKRGLLHCMERGSAEAT